MKNIHLAAVIAVLVGFWTLVGDSLAAWRGLALTVVVLSAILARIVFGTNRSRIDSYSDIVRGKD